MVNLPTGNAAARPPGGPPKDSKEAATGKPSIKPQPWWLIFLALIMVNYLVMRVLFQEPPLLGPDNGQLSGDASSLPGAALD
jgi:hypothetical protein